jgi:23S rRNA pseudouridine1911/1915/1917 synthase
VSTPTVERLVVEPSDAGERIDKLLARRLVGVSRATVQRWIDEGRVLMGGKPCRSKDSALLGSTIEVAPGPRPATDAEPDANVVFRVLFEDAHLIVVDKPAGLVVHPARGHATGTLVNGLLARGGFERPPADPRDPEGSLRPGIVHRIDKDTSGILVVAKDEPSREGLKEQLSAHTVERVYLALTLGVPRAGVIESLHARDPKSRLRFTSRTATGRRAVTRVAIREVLAAGRAAFVECRLETGRTHQIRVHLAEQTRTPLLSDALYGSPPRDPEIAQIAADLGRQALHAAVLGFVHPITKQNLRFESSLPKDIALALENLRRLTTP